MTKYWTLSPVWTILPSGQALLTFLLYSWRSITHYELYALKDNDTYYYNDYADFDGMSIGVLAKNHLDALDDYAAAHHFSFETILWKQSTAGKALEDNTVDCHLCYKCFPPFGEKDSCKPSLLFLFIL